MLQGCYRQMWYLTGELIPFTLIDLKVSEEERQEVARALHAMPRGPTNLGKPVFPCVEWTLKPTLPRLATFVTKDSWTLPDRLGLKGPNVS